MRILHTYLGSGEVITAQHVFLIDSSRYVYSYNPETNELVDLFHPTAGSSVDLAATNDKMWLPACAEYDITLNPFSATYFRDITINTYGTAMTAIDNTHLISGSFGTSEIWAHDITGSTSINTLLFTMPDGRTIQGDILYNPISDRYIVTNSLSGTSHITEFDSSGNILYDIVTSYGGLFGMFEYKEELYVFSCSSYTSTLLKLTEGITVPVFTVPIEVYGAAQRIQNMTVNLPRIPTYTDPFQITVSIPYDGYLLNMPFGPYGTRIFDCTVNYGDGTSLPITAYNDANVSHTYATAGTYQISITGKCTSIDFFAYSNFQDKVISIDNWGDIGALKFNMARCYNLVSIAPVCGDFFKFVDSGIYLFYDCRLITYSDLPVDLLGKAQYVTNLNAAFTQCYALTNVRGDLLRDCSRLISAVNMFGYCTALESPPSGLFDHSPLINDLTNLYTNCTSPNFSSIPIDFFKYLVNLQVLSYAFYLTKITSIPTDLLRYNIKLEAVQYTFYNTLITSIPDDLLRYNPLINNYLGVFGSNALLETAPLYLLKYSTRTTIDFRQVFISCVKLQINKNLFYADGEESTIFLNKTIDFTNTFNRATFTGIQGEAPDLWNCDFGTGVVTKTGCFTGAGNSLTSISNYADIPIDWK